MGVNFSHFEIGRRALRAHQLGVTVAGQNIANVNTPGYSRQAVQLSATPPGGSNLRLTGAGVTIDGVRSFRDRFIESRLQSETAIAGRLTARRDALAPVEAAFDETRGGGVSSALQRFFGAFGDLEAHPNSVPARSVVVEQGVSLAAAFRTTHTRLTGIRRDADAAIESTIGEVNRLAARVANLNAQIGIAEGSGSNAYELRDERSEIITQLADLTGARSTENADGSVTLTLADGQALVIADRAAQLAVTLTPGAAPSFTLDGTPTAINDGRLGGLFDATATIDKQITALDELAASIASRVNTLHASGSDLDGNDGVPFFAAPAGGAPYTAANLEVSAALRLAPSRVVAAARGAGSGDASVARSLSNLLTDASSTVGTRTGSSTLR